jgi:hypothetical protein
MPNKYGTRRLCVDFHGLSKITKKNCYPLLLISKVIDYLSGTSYYIKLKIYKAYYRLKIGPEEI